MVSFALVHDGRPTILYTRVAILFLVLLLSALFVVLQTSPWLISEVTRTLDVGEDLKGIASLRDTRSSVQLKRHHHQTQQSQNLHIVISHCDRPIDWIWRHYLREHPYKSITILSKCGQQPSLDDLPSFASSSSATGNEPLIQVMTLPNVGRCDHSYAFWIAKMLGENRVDEFASYNVTYTNQDELQRQERIAHFRKYGRDRNKNNFYFNRTDIFQNVDIAPDDFILFMKDNDNAYRSTFEDEIPLQEMMQALSLHGTRDTASLFGFEHEDTINGRSFNYRNTTTTNPLRTFSSKLNTMLLRPHKKNSQITNPLAPATFVCASKLRTGGFPSFFNNQYDIELQRRERATNLAHRQVLWDFEKSNYVSSAGLLQREEDDVTFTSPYRPMGKWVEHLESRGVFDAGFYVSQNHFNIVPVCFGGNFMSSMRAIRQSPVRDWAAVVESLSRGNNIEEGHFMERLWADLLSQPLSLDQEAKILDYKSRHFPEGAFGGMIVRLTPE